MLCCKKAFGTDCWHYLPVCGKQLTSNTLLLLLPYSPVKSNVTSSMVCK
jgi:hypothetical protein